MRFIVHDVDADMQDNLGGKARALTSLRDADMPIPRWFVILPDAFHASTMDAPSPEVTQAIAKAVTCLGPHASLFAVRSSASDEDGSQHSFAGQLDSFLAVRAEQVTAKVAAVWRSGFSERIVAYRREHGLSLKPRPPAVLVQHMINARAAGVAFGADPVSGRRDLTIVSAVNGLGTSLVSGDADADTYHVDHTGTIGERVIAHKRFAHSPSSESEEGFKVVEATRPDDPAVSDEEVRAIATLTRQCGKHFARPQDIEWAIEDGQLYLLQSRPITSLSNIYDPQGAFNLWDNSNIAESYNGVTTPLTFSFARKAYEEVYRQFCRMLSVPKAKIEASDEVFRHMLGLIRGRVYYNLLNWYRLLTLLPGFKSNRGFMEQMMGVKEALPEHLVEEMTKATLGERLRDRVHLTGSILAMMRHQWTISRQIRRFYDRLETALGKKRPDLSGKRTDELVRYYRDLESKLLTRWDAPLLNDFFAMIFYGLLGKLTRKWCGDEAGTLQNDLLCGEGGMISAEPAQRVREMATVAANHPALTDALCDGTLSQVRQAMKSISAFHTLYDGYLDKFGDRCLEELKLESPTLFDQPLTLLRSVGQLARKIRHGEGPTLMNHEVAIRQKAEERVSQALRFRPTRRLLFRWVLKNARARVRDRENLRFERTRLFGRVRDILLELGRRFFADDLLEHPRDVFYLEVEEVLGFVDGTATTTNLKGLVNLRQTEFARFKEMPAPSDRFETHGTIPQGNRFEGKSKSVAMPTGDSLRGLGCCPGVVRGPARVVTDPRNATLKTGDILVAERTDPGWIMLFPSAAGLLVERGSLLSHSAIVAREMGIPAIVSLTGVTRWLKDGDLVELDGATGIVTRLSS